MNLNWHELELTRSWLNEGAVLHFFASSCNNLQFKLGFFLTFFFFLIKRERNLLQMFFPFLMFWSLSRLTCFTLALQYHSQSIRISRQVSSVTAKSNCRHVIVFTPRFLFFIIKSNAKQASAASPVLFCSLHAKLGVC